MKIDSANSCENTSNPFIASSVGIGEMGLKNNLKIYPNPCNSELTIEVDGSEKLSLQLFDITGKSVTPSFEFVHKTSINTQDLHEGIYFLKITDDNGTFVKTEKLIVVR